MKTVPCASIMSAINPSKSMAAAVGYAPAKPPAPIRLMADAPIRTQQKISGYIPASHAVRSIGTTSTGTAS
ncbi:MAG: hypothetical protein FWH53_07490 [Leptospirales bacterium]|nr:hypothetical protein [Leptospirales bacterium]